MYGDKCVSTPQKEDITIFEENSASHVFENRTGGDRNFFVDCEIQKRPLKVVTFIAKHTVEVWILRTELTVYALVQKSIEGHLSSTQK